MRSSQSYRQFLIKGLIAFVIIVAGVVAGIFVANKTGLAGQHNDQHELKMLPSAALREGALFPDISVLVKDGTTIRLLDTVEHTAANTTVIVFASSGCLPCHEFLEALSASAAVQQSRMGVILLVDHIEKFSSFSRYPTFELSSRQEAELEVHTFPTSVSVASDGTIKGVWLNYNPNDPPGFM